MNFNPKKPAVLEHLPFEGYEKIQMSLLEKIFEAEIAVARLDAYVKDRDNYTLLLSPIYLAEALSSSEIEQIHSTLLSVLESQLKESGEDLIETDQKIVNYTQALMWTQKAVRKFGLSTRLIKGIHSKLLPFELSEYRREQNQIINSSTKEIRFTPPEPQNINDLMSNWEKFVNDPLKGSPLLRAAVGHFQFEAIHPFTDGNGRTGRILLLMQLIDSGILELPIIHISQYVNKHRSEYYDLLLRVSSHNDWEGFISFILSAYRSQAEASYNLLRSIHQQFTVTLEEVQRKLPKIYKFELVQALFQYPVITATKLSQELNVVHRTASSYLKELEGEGFLSSVQRGRYRYFYNTTLIELLRQADIE